MERIKARLISETKSKRKLSVRFLAHGQWFKREITVFKKKSEYTDGVADVDEGTLLRIEQEAGGTIERVKTEEIPRSETS